MTTYQRGDRFKRRLPRFVGKIPDMSDLFYAEDGEFEHMSAQQREFELALFVETLAGLDDPDYYLRLLEDDYALPHDGSVEQRIASVLAKMRGKRATTVEVVLAICEVFGHRAEYKPLYERYAFLLRLVGSRKYGKRFLDALREAIPAHLDMEFEMSNGDALIYADGAKSYVMPLYITGTNRHKTGTVYRHQYTGRATRDRLQLGEGVRTPQQRVPKTKEPHAGQVYNYAKGEGT